MIEIYRYSRAAKINRYLKSSSLVKRSWQLRWTPISASTEIDLSRWIKYHPNLSGQSRAVFASKQNFGKGQFNKTWLAPRGGVWVSAVMLGSYDLSESTEMFGLALAFALSERIKSKGIPVKIKWPNDLLCEDRKLAGILPKLIFRGNNLRLARVGIGLNVSNRVPKGGISLSELIGNKKLNIDKWSCEVIIAIERSMELLKQTSYLCDQVEKILWKKEITDPISGLKWRIKNITDSGGLRLSRNNQEMIWTRWD